MANKQYLFEDACEQHLRSLTVYGNPEDNKLYYDSEYEEEAELDKVLNAYRKRLLLIETEIDGETVTLAPIGVGEETAITAYIVTTDGATAEDSSTTALAYQEWTLPEAPSAE